MSMLLSPVEMAKLSLKNRVVMAPMCTYEVKKEDGIITPFHFAHYGARAISGVSLIILEATSVVPEGRISNNDLGLWNDEQAVELKKLVDSLHYLGAKAGIQLAHAGRKAQDEAQPVAPSALAFNENFNTPIEMSKEEIKRTQVAFIEAAKRAVDAGFDMLELHGAHGYLINQFLSPAINQRTDEYGGSLENRYRFAKEIIQGIREFYQGSLWIRLSLTDYVEAPEQNTLEEWQQVARWLEADQVDCIDVSTGGVLNTPVGIPVHAGYQVSYATALKQAVKIPVAAVGLLGDAGLCEYVLQNQQADLVLQGRALLRNTNWLADAAEDLHDKNFKVFNASYERGQI